ncbi:MAG: hypothetical protein KDJ16_07475 [Hyphomicrobiales bacterium]|nr:hypothetical protein [Hyphomicrobiales bacterium]
MDETDRSAEGFISKLRGFLLLPLIRLLAANMAAGIVAAVTAVTALITFDVAGMGTLIGAAEDPVLPVVLLIFGFIVTLAGVAMATAVMSLPYDRGEPDDDHGRAAEVDLEPVRVVAPRRDQFRAYRR